MIKGSVLFATLFILTGFISVCGQTQSQYDKGTPPQLAAGVSSVSSYMSTELGTVNLSNGGLNLNIPLGTVGGRGNVALPLVLSYSSKVWSASMDVDTERESGTEQSVAYADYDNQGSFGGAAAPGWTLRAGMYLSSSFVRIKKITVGQSTGCYTYGLHKLTLNLPDKGEIEFRDDTTDGAPLLLNCTTQQTASRGTRWHATDGSGAIFINDVDNGVGLFPSPNLSGTVIFADGTRFGSTTNGHIVDRNGNRITGTFDGFTDQLGRNITLQYGVNDPDNPAVTLAVLITIPGYQGAPRYYKIKTGIMNQNYRSDVNPTLPVISGDWDPEGWGYNWGTATRLFAKSYGLYAQRIDDREVLTELALPDGRSLKFRYNQFGEVAEVELPTGAKIKYDYNYRSSLPSGNSPSWETGTNGFGSGIVTDVKFVDRAVTAKRTYPDGVNLEGTWTFDYGSKVINSVTYPATTATVNSNTAALLFKQRHIFLQAGRYTESYGGLNPHDGTHYTLWSTGVEWRTESIDGAGNVLAATEQDWTQRAPVSWSSYPQEQPANDNRVNQTRRYLETGMMAKVETTYDQYSNPIEVKEYDYDQTLKRRTLTSYLSTNNGYNYQTEDSIHLLGLPETQTVYDGSGNQVARTVTEYDVYTNDGNHDVLTSYASVSQHDSNYGTTKTTRGNPTRIGNWLNTTGAYIYVYPRYDVLGNVVAIKEARGNVSTVSFADDFGDGSTPGSPTQNPSTPTYALPTLITSPPPLPGATAHTARSQYDYSTGLMTGFRDRNSVVTQTIYDDPFNRATQVNSALGVSGVESHAKMYYAPSVTPFGITLANNDVLTATDQAVVNDANLRSWTVTDGFGRTKEAWTRDSQGDVKVAVLYDALGRATQVSNPFRPSLSETAIYSQTSYDLLGRVTTLTTPDGSVVSTAYSANTVTVTDQATKKRKSVTDALGRLKEVYEDPDSLNYLTSYQYDTLDSLITVNQGTQTRTFTYNSLKQLLSATNPESGTITYQYDNGGNLTQKSDGRGIVSVYAYDALNRNTTIDYSDTSGINPDVSRFYDGAANGKGRLWYSYAGGSESVGSNVEKTVIDSYDALGRALIQQQRFKLNGTWAPLYQTTRSYNLAGSVLSQTYPSGHTVSYSYDNAARLSSFAGNLGDGNNRTYTTALSYASAGQMKQEQLGTTTPVYNKLFYNSRQQLAEILLSTTGGDSSWNRGKILNQYSLQCSGAGCNATDNNGNLRKQEVYVPANDQVSSYTSWYQQYDYDELNRLKRVHEYTGTPALDWQQEYLYDRWGNRRIDVANTFGVGINNKNFETEDATNRLYSLGDLALPDAQRRIRYDAAGNQTKDTYTGYGNAIFDAENHIIAIQDSSAGWTTYTYNADGQRTRRKINNQETWQIYGIDGELLAEYPANGSVTSPQKEYGYRNGQLLVTAEPGTASYSNVALASSGATVTSSSTLSPYVASNVIDGSRRAINNTLWLDNTFNSFGDWVEVNFNGSKTISEIDVITQQDDPGNLVEPTLTQTFSLYGITAFDVQYWNGSAWTTVPGGSVTGNNKVWRQFTFSPVTTTKIRVVVNGGADNAYSRVVEVEAWTGTAPTPTNYARTTNGGSVTASSTLSPYVAGNVIDGSRQAINWTLWLDNTFNSFGDWVEVNFNGSKTITEIDVVTQQDDPGNLVEPTLTQTFSLYGITAFDVQYWNGSAWTTVPGGSVTGNNKVWRQFTFSPVTTTKIRVVVNGGADNAYSRVVEVEAWGQDSTSTSSNIHWLVSDQLGTPRMVLDQTGSLANIKRHDYLPFGEELFTDTGLRSATVGYTTTTDGVRQQFTEKERDSETGLDYFLARYYSSPQGRFTGVDPLTGSGKPEVPQSWNRYSYCINNPLLFVDPDGLIWGYQRNDKTGVTTYQWFEGDQVGEGFTEVTNFYVEGVIDGKSVSLTLNPNGPRSFWSQLAIDLDPGLSLLADNSDYVVKGYQIGETQAQFAERSRTGAVDMMPNQAFEVGLFLGGLRGGGAAGGGARGGLSMEGKAYELGLLKRHLPGTPEATKLAGSRSSAHVFNDLSTLSRVESEIFARGTYTGSQNGFARFGLRFGEPIGTRIARDGTRTALDYGELKLRDNGLYHVIPRTGPRQ